MPANLCEATLFCLSSLSVQGKIPFVIRRHLPNGSYEDWPVDQLIVE